MLQQGKGKCGDISLDFLVREVWAFIPFVTLKRLWSLCYVNHVGGWNVIMQFSLMARRDYKRSLYSGYSFGILLGITDTHHLIAY